MWQAPSPCALPLRCPAGSKYLEGGILKALTVVCHMALLQPALSLGRVSGTAGLRYEGEGGEASTYSWFSHHREPGRVSFKPCVCALVQAFVSIVMLLLSTWPVGSPYWAKAGAYLMVYGCRGGSG